jgi:hypothetical protein
MVKDHDQTAAVGGIGQRVLDEANWTKRFTRNIRSKSYESKCLKIYLSSGILCYKHWIQVVLQKVKAWIAITNCDYKCYNDECAETEDLLGDFPEI